MDKQRYFSIAVKVILSLSDRYKIFTSNWLWIEICENVVLTTNSKEFFKTFKPFLGSKTCINKQAEINLKVNGIVVSDQTTVAETLACHFATLADSIGGDRAQQSEKQLCNHPSLARIRLNCQNEQAITVAPTNRTQVLCALESLKTSEATGNDAIPAKVLKLGARELATPSLSYITPVSPVESGQVNGKGGNGYPSLRRTIISTKRTTDRLLSFLLWTRYLSS